MSIVTRWSFTAAAADALVGGGLVVQAEAPLKPPLYGMRHLRDEARADDLAQEVMVTVLRRLRAGEVQELERIGSFILGTARWLCRDERRRETRATELAKRMGEQLSEAVQPVLSLDTERLATALAALSERERAVVVLSFFEDQTSEEIASSLGLRPSHVRVIRHRALARLMTLFGPAEPGQGEEAS